MLKILNKGILLLLFFVLLEFMMYIKDYNELMIINGYIKYEIKNNELMSVDNERYSVSVYNDGNYEIILKRESLFVFSKYKKIKYVGIVE